MNADVLMGIFVLEILGTRWTIIRQDSSKFITDFCNDVGINFSLVNMGKYFFSYPLIAIIQIDHD